MIFLKFKAPEMLKITFQGNYTVMAAFCYLLRHSLVTQMKEEEDSMETTTVPQQHSVCLPIAFPFRVVLVLLNLQCANSMHFWSGTLREGMWQTTSREDAFC